MTSTGNDIVALTAINVTRTKGPEFYSKIISPSEKELYHKIKETLPFEYFVWLLWSVKESAFKYLQRLDSGVVFIPVKFEVKQLQIPANQTISNFGAYEICGNGFDKLVVWNSVLSIGANTLYSKTLIYKEFISSVVNPAENFDNTYWGIKRIENTAYKYQSAAVRELLIHKLHELTGLENLVIDKNAAGVPVLLNGGEEMAIPVSLSHHERWVGYSFEIKFE